VRSRAHPHPSFFDIAQCANPHSTSHVGSCRHCMSPLFFFSAFLFRSFSIFIRPFSGRSNDVRVRLFFLLVQVRSFFFSFPPTAPLLSTVPTWGPPLTGKYEWNLVPISPRFPVYRALSLANMKGAKQHRVARPFVASPLSPFVVSLLVVSLLVVSLSLSRRVTLVALPSPSRCVALAPCPLVGSPLPLPRHIALALRHSFVVPLSLPLTIFWQGCHSSWCTHVAVFELSCRQVWCVTEKTQPQERAHERPSQMTPDTIPVPSCRPSTAYRFPWK